MQVLKLHIRETKMTSETANERRDRTRKEIKQLIEERNSVLAQYYNLAKQSNNLDLEHSENNPNSTLELLEEFCQELVDYMAIGHFELYRRIEEGTERRDEITRLAEKIMPRINITTQIAVAFNDLYDDTSNLNDEVINQLPTYLAQLGEELATRIDLEDQFIDTLLMTGGKPTLTAVSA
jgi:regulator of sigma D